MASSSGLWRSSPKKRAGTTDVGIETASKMGEGRKCRRFEMEVQIEIAVDMVESVLRSHVSAASRVVGTSLPARGDAACYQPRKSWTEAEDLESEMLRGTPHQNQSSSRTGGLSDL